ncbi:hypothetical protein GF377_11160, partial [candidate division GN15 bacterium]|nr:hypothetical protein [candidate division GN15 bacterium]
MARSHSLTFAILMALLMFAVSASAQVTYIKAVSQTEPMQAQGQQIPARTDTVEQWVGEAAAYMDSQGQSVLIKTDESKLYILNDNAK